MSLSELCTENCFNILDFLPQRYYKNIALVNKYFYNIFLNRPIRFIDLETIAKKDMIEDLKIRFNLPIFRDINEISQLFTLCIKYFNMNLAKDVLNLNNSINIHIDTTELSRIIKNHLEIKNFDIIVFILELNKTKKLEFNKDSILLPIKNNCDITIYNEYFKKYFLIHHNNRNNPNQ